MRLGSKSTTLTVALLFSRLIRFGEAGHRAAQRIRGTGRVIAVQSAEPGCGNQERFRRADLFVQGLHGREQQLRADPGRFAPLRIAHARKIRLAVESRQPVHALDRAFGFPAFDILRQKFGIRRAVDNERLNAELFQSANQRFSHSALIRHHDDPASGVQNARR